MSLATGIPVLYKRFLAKRERCHLEPLGMQKNCCSCCAGNRARAPTSEPQTLVICGRWCYQQNVLGNMEKRGSAFLLVPKRFDVLLDALRAGVSSLDLPSTRLWFQEPIFSAWKITKSVGHTGVPAQYEEQPLQQTSQNHVCCCYVA